MIKLAKESRRHRKLSLMTVSPQSDVTTRLGLPSYPRQYRADELLPPPYEN